MTEQTVRQQVRRIMEQVANNDTHLASIECADDLATLALAEWMSFQQGNEDMVGKLFKIALALGYETRRRHESYKPLDESVWNNAFDGDTEWD
ncbi:MAG TPA: hypothetical protein VF177_16230 [Anaerolineae bacterium]